MVDVDGPLGPRAWSPGPQGDPVRTPQGSGLAGRWRRRQAAMLATPAPTAESIGTWRSTRWPFKVLGYLIVAFFLMGIAARVLAHA